jgi:hypothetical protein
MVLKEMSEQLVASVTSAPRVKIGEAVAVRPRRGRRVKGVRQCILTIFGVGGLLMSVSVKVLESESWKG